MATDERCGTIAGYSAHRRRKEETCPACRAANVAYFKARIEAGIDQRSKKRTPAGIERSRSAQRTYAKVRGRALQRLAHEYPERLRQLMDEERRRIGEDE